MASKLGAALGYSMDLGGGKDEAESPDDAEPPASVSEPKPKEGGSAEVMAMKMFEKATSPEAKVTALKAFLEACGAIGSDY